MGSQIDFGYPWWLSYGHLVIAALAVALLLLGRSRKWSRTSMACLSLLFVWAVGACLASWFVIHINGRAALPTSQFLTRGEGRIIDLGAGTGRSSLMVLDARPQTTLVALDLFTESFRQHFGSIETGQEKLRSNLRAAGVEQRVTIQAGDMRKLPFEAATFDGAVSSYAIDHLSRADVALALAEASRVLKPGGEFLLMVIEKDWWLKGMFGPLLYHGGTRGKVWWTGRMQEAGFQPMETGTVPWTLYILARKP